MTSTFNLKKTRRCFSSPFSFSENTKLEKLSLELSRWCFWHESGKEREKLCWFSSQVCGASNRECLSLSLKNDGRHFAGKKPNSFRVLEAKNIYVLDFPSSYTFPEGSMSQSEKRADFERFKSSSDGEADNHHHGSGTGIRTSIILCHQLLASYATILGFDLFISVSRARFLEN